MLCRSGFPRSYRGTSASASGVLGLKVRSPKPHLQYASFFFFQTGWLFVTVLAVPGTHFVDQAGLQLTEICLPLCLLSVGIKGVPSVFFLTVSLYLWRLSWNSLCRPGLFLNINRSAYLCLQSAGIKGMCYHCLASFNIF